MISAGSEIHAGGVDGACDATIVGDGGTWRDGKGGHHMEEMTVVSLFKMLIEIGSADKTAFGGPVTREGVGCVGFLPR